MIQQMLNIAPLAGEEIVKANHFIAAGDEPIAQMAA
jgi:hypothetical protein